MRDLLILVVCCLMAVEADAQVKEEREGLWGKTKKLGSDALQSVQKKYGELREGGAKPEAEGKAEKEQPAPKTDETSEWFRKMWSEALSMLEKGMSIRQRMETAPESRTFGADKKSLRKDFERTLDGLAVALGGTGLTEYQKRIDALKSEVETAKREILTCKEKREAAPVKHLIYSTKEDYDEKIEALEKKVAASQKQIDSIKGEVKGRLSALGIEMTPQQIDVLLARVDTDNIAQMCEVFNSVKLITTRLMDIMRSSEEDVEYAKRYYGMHVVLVECMIHIQRKYVGDIDDTYQPRIEKLIEEAERVREASVTELEREAAPARRKVYEGNIRAQELTMKTARLYLNVLEKQRGKLGRARERLQRDLVLAQNTYDTVRVSAELLSLLKSSKNTFDTLMSLQIPELVPFENAEMQKKFGEITAMIAD